MSSRHKTTGFFFRGEEGRGLGGGERGLGVGGRGGGRGKGEEG